MAKNKSAPTKKARRAPKGRRNLSVANYGDKVVIKNRSTVSVGLFGTILLALCVFAMIKIRWAWGFPVFWICASVIAAGMLSLFINMMLSKIVLDSPKTIISVYRPFEKQYKFSDVNYVDVNTTKHSDGLLAYTVILYIGVGKKTIQMTSFSKDQADELVALFRGMLDHGAMEYPEGDEEPFNFDDEKEGGFTFLKRKKKTQTTEDDEPTTVTAAEITSMSEDRGRAEEKKTEESDGEDSDDEDKE